MARIFDEFEALGVAAEPVVYGDRASDAILNRLLQMDAVLVWVDPIVRGEERTLLDSVLRTAASRGVFVSAHPDVILTMGTKEVLYRTRGMAWGTDTQVYRSEKEIRELLPGVLRLSGPRVLKQNRGSGGNGVWKVEVARPDAGGPDPVVRVQHGARGAAVEELPFSEFLARCRQYFAAFGGSGCIVDQPYCRRLAEGMIRCYLVQDRIAGFGHQFVTALMPPPAGSNGPPDPPPRLYYGPDRLEYQRIGRLMEESWLPEMQRILGIERDSLPIIWDADFLLGPPDPAGADTYMLCEINVSGVFPIPDESVAPLARATVERATALRNVRSGRFPPVHPGRDRHQ
jgi:hypothetical protein